LSLQFYQISYKRIGYFRISEAPPNYTAAIIVPAMTALCCNGKHSQILVVN